MSTDIARKPYFVIDGDTIGYSIIEKDESPADDFQTEEDKEMRRVLEVANPNEGKRIVKESNFKMCLDF